MKIQPGAAMRAATLAAACGFVSVLACGTAGQRRLPAPTSPPDPGGSFRITAPADAHEAGASDALPARSPPAPAVTVLAEVVASGDAAGTIAVDSSWVYWIDDARGVVRAPRRGGPATTVAAGVWTGRVTPSRLALDTDAVYWFVDTSDGTEPGHQALYRQDKSGGERAVVRSHSDVLGRFVVDGDSIYWLEGNAVFKSAKEGRRPLRIVSGQSLSWSGGLAVDEARVYWSHQGSRGAIRAAAKTGGRVVVEIVTGAGRARDVHVDGDNVYWVSDDQLMAAPKAGGRPTPLARASSAIDAIALDDAFVYFTVPGALDLADGSVSRVAKTGGARTVLASGQPQPSAIAVDGDSVYWACRGTFRAAGGPPEHANVSRVDKP